MNGGFLHEVVTLDRLESLARDAGADAARQVRTPTGGYIDLVITIGTHRIAVEAELTSKRVANDLEKAVSAEATELWVVTPVPRTARSVKRGLNRVNRNCKTPVVFVLTLGRAIQRLTNCFSLFSGSLTPPENKKQITNNPQNTKGPKP